MLTSLRTSGKIQAFLIHLGISAGVVGVLALLMLTLWYPQPWFAQDGGWHVFRLILLVDVVLGPTLTLVVFRRGKPGLRRDLSVIGSVQAAALAYGAVLMFLYRPAFLVYAENNFFTVPWPDVKQATRDLARIEPLAAPRGPGTVMLRLPKDPAEQARIFANARAGGGSGDRVVIAMGDFYEAMTPEHWQLVFNRSANIAVQAADNPDIKREFERFRATNTQPLENLAFVPVVCRYGVIMLVFDRKTAALVGWLN
jgi:hypothetical protein